jgi:hypothetical protein
MAIIAFRTRRNEPPRGQAPQVVVVIVTGNEASAVRPQPDRFSGSETTPGERGLISN